MIKMSKLYVAMVVMDEEEHIEGALDSVSDIAERIIVVDTGSTDSTVSIVGKNSRCRLFERPWPGSYGTGRNLPIRIIREKFTQDPRDHILSLDGDEILSRQDAIPKALESETSDGYYLMKNHLVPGGWFGHRSLKLFRNRPELEYVGKICELLEPRIDQIGGRTSCIETTINDFGFMKEQQHVMKKIQKYVGMLKDKVSAKNDAVDHIYLSYFLALAGEYQKSIDWLDKVKDPNIRIGANFQKACILYQMEEFDHSESIIDTMIDNGCDPFTLSEMHNKKGQIESRRKNLDNARQEYCSAIELNPERDVCWFNHAALGYVIEERVDDETISNLTCLNPIVSGLSFVPIQHSLNTFNELDENYIGLQNLLDGAK
mgnify:CR=1 FL=1